MRTIFRHSGMAKTRVVHGVLMVVGIVMIIIGLYLAAMKRLRKSS